MNGVSGHDSALYWLYWAGDMSETKMCYAQQNTVRD